MKGNLCPDSTNSISFELNSDILGKSTLLFDVKSEPEVSIGQSISYFKFEGNLDQEFEEK